MNRIDLEGRQAVVTGAAQGNRLGLCGAVNRFWRARLRMGPGRSPVGKGGS